jgi:hypothetical protein
LKTTLKLTSAVVPSGLNALTVAWVPAGNGPTALSVALRKNVVNLASSVVWMLFGVKFRPLKQ